MVQQTAPHYWGIRLEAASKCWESFEGREYVRYERPDLSDLYEVPHATGIAVYQNNAVVHFCFRLFRNTSLAHYGLRADVVDPGLENFRCSHAEFIGQPLHWRKAAPNETPTIWNEWRAFFIPGPGKLHFRPRLNLYIAYQFGLLEGMPEGYLALDQATRHSIPGRLTNCQLRELIRKKFVYPGQKVMLKNDSFKDVAPQGYAVVETLGRDTRTRSLVIAKFPCNFPSEAPALTHIMPANYLRFYNGTLSYVPPLEDEWLPSQYEAAEKKRIKW